jgi:ubiquinone/menaquinone biosynthesis C-methylase UbiE
MTFSKERHLDQLYFEIFESLPRQGPGNDESTQKAFSKLIGLPEQPTILDVGCGTGRQTLVLAKLSKGNITALDNHTQFIETLKDNARHSGCADRIHCITGDMNSMNFPTESFDVIWSEGAAYIMVFKKALAAWKPLLRSKAYLVVSELVWFKKEAPQEIHDFFAQGYPDMKYYEHFFTLLSQPDTR